MPRDDLRTFKLIFSDGREKIVTEPFGSGSPEYVARKYGAQTAYRTDAQRGQGYGRHRNREICGD